MNPEFHYLFGPVPSRRLGRSLGVDVTPGKTCSFDCRFCQCGPTRNLTTDREEFAPIEDVCDELSRWLAGGGSADVITFAGSGEPTLYSRLGELIGWIKAQTGLPVVVLSNGTLFHRQLVRDDLQKADIVKTSLSAWDEPSFQTVNRPAPGVSFHQLLAGARDFRAVYSGQFWLEVFVINGVNSDPDTLRKIAAIAETIGPDTIHLNTAVRPPADKSILPVSETQLAACCDLFTPKAEIIASFGAEGHTGRNDPAELAGLIRRHPATAEQLAALAGVHAEEIIATLAPLVADGTLQTEENDGEMYYR